MNTSLQQLRRSSEWPDSICWEIGGFSLDFRKGKIYKAMVSCYAPQFTRQWGENRRSVFSDTCWDTNGQAVWPWGSPWLLPSTAAWSSFGVNNPIAFCMPGRLLPKGSGQVYPCPFPGSWHQVCYAAPKVGGAVSGSVRGPTEGNRNQSQCCSKVWALQYLLGHGCLSCWRSSDIPSASVLTAASQISPIDLGFSVLGYFPFAPGRLVTEARNTSAISILSSWPAPAPASGWEQLLGCWQAKHLCVRLSEVLLETRWCRGWKGSRDLTPAISVQPGHAAAEVLVGTMAVAETSWLFPPPVE